MLRDPAAIAIDAGGTTTRAMVVTREGDCSPVALSGRGNPVGDAALAATNIADACRVAMSKSRYTPRMVVAAVAGTVSRGFPELSTHLRDCAPLENVIVVSDLLATDARVAT